MTENEQKQNEYAENRLANATRLGINAAIHGLTNICFFSNKAAQKENESNLWIGIKNDAEKTLADLLLLKVKIEMVIGPEKQVEKE